MKRYLGASTLLAVLAALVTGCSSMGSVGSATSAFQKLGGSQSVSSLANGLVNSSLKDPRLSGLTAGKNIDATAASGKVSNQLCAMLGGGCSAPVSDSQMASAASKITPDQSKAISENFSSALKGVTSDPSVQQMVTKTVGSKLPGVLGSVL
jgi:PBP1b-binding outer membrane lipoprotein LpoB